MEPLWRNEGYGRYVPSYTLKTKWLVADDLSSTIFSALGAGILTGKYNEGVPDGSRFHLNPEKSADDRLVFLQSDKGKALIQKVRELTKVAEELGGSMANLALAWALTHPNVSTVIVSRPRLVSCNSS